ncbi:MAG: SEC-C domain-containing protein [Myxococcaceae bacterium]|nr:SEC-C domain-containing protein [Myxococcaceae bacterium]
MKDACPCGSGHKYAACCRRFHRGEEPPDAVTLMRSRFAAYALGEVAYLWRTLDPDHPDRQTGEEAHTASVRRARQALRYVRLRVLEVEEAPGSDRARVLFHAEIYERGKDRSFAERSEFRRVDGVWRYRRGDARTIPAGSLSLETLRASDFD